MFCKGSRRRTSSESLSLMRLGCGSGRTIVISLLPHESFVLVFYPTECAPNPPYPSEKHYPSPHLGTCDCRYSVSRVRLKNGHRSPRRAPCYTYSRCRGPRWSGTNGLRSLEGKLLQTK